MNNIPYISASEVAEKIEKSHPWVRKILQLYRQNINNRCDLKGLPAVFKNGSGWQVSPTAISEIKKKKIRKK